jgi:hypothetical protein
VPLQALTTMIALQLDFGIECFAVRNPDIGVPSFARMFNNSIFAAVQ